MSANIKKFFLELLNSALGSDVSSQILDLKIEDSARNIKIISVIDTELVPKIRNFASNIETHQNALAKQLQKERVSIIFSAKADKRNSANRNSTPKQKYKLPNVKKVILVASGKGGVGKSTFASLLALHLAELKFNVGLLDADIYGPSIPHIFNIESKPEIEDGKIHPIKKQNIELMSAGFLIDSGSAAIWRGPMANKAIHQMLSGVKWGEGKPLDYLIIDTPPGTGDIHISILEKYVVDAAIVVTTPSKLAVNDVVKSLNLFEITNTKIVGMVCNMDHVITDSGEKVRLFEEFDQSQLPSTRGVAFIRLPMLKSIASNCTADVMVGQLGAMAKQLNVISDALV